MVKTNEERTEHPFAKKIFMNVINILIFKINFIYNIC